MLRYVHCSEAATSNKPETSCPEQVAKPRLASKPDHQARAAASLQQYTGTRGILTWWDNGTRCHNAAGLHDHSIQQGGTHADLLGLGFRIRDHSMITADGSIISQGSSLHCEGLCSLV